MFSWRRAIKFIARIGLLASASAPAYATTLYDVYQQALDSDPTFKQATATWYAARQNLPIARAGMLPSFSATGSFYREFSQTVPVIASVVNPDGMSWSSSYGLTLTQPIFNVTAWRQIAGAKANVKAAAATYAYAAQDLMVRVTEAYFNVMRAYERLRFTKANKRAVWQQLEQARQKFNVGLISITGVYDAQSVYDQAVAAEIADRNALDNRLEDLRAITGHYYSDLTSIKNQILLVAPRPNNINRWVNTAVQQNYNIKSQKFTVIEARENIKVASAARFPVISAQATYNSEFSNPDADVIGNIRIDNATMGFTATATPFQGGLITARTRQLMYVYLNASAQMDFTYRDVVSKTRQAFLGVTSGISQVQADKQAIISAKNALEATKAGYDVGTRTMVDVLDDLSSVYRAEQTYYDDQYIYLQNIVQLKANAGTLSADDLRRVSVWMKKKIRVPKVQTSYVPIKFVKPKLETAPKEFDPSVSPTPSTEPRRLNRLRLPPAPDALSPGLMPDSTMPSMPGSSMPSTPTTPTTPGSTPSSPSVPSTPTTPTIPSTPGAMPNTSVPSTPSTGTTPRTTLPNSTTPTSPSTIPSPATPTTPTTPATPGNSTTPQSAPVPSQSLQNVRLPDIGVTILPAPEVSQHAARQLPGPDETLLPKPSRTY